MRDVASGPYSGKTEGIDGHTIGVTEDVGSRRTMEDAHSFVVDYAGIQGQGYFAIFDGHAGKRAAEWCGQNFHEVSLVLPFSRSGLG